MNILGVNQVSLFFTYTSITLLFLGVFSIADTLRVRALKINATGKTVFQN